MIRRWFDIFLIRRWYDDISMIRRWYDISLIRRLYDISLIRRWYDISLTPRMWKILPLSSWEQGELTWRDESPDLDLVERRTDLIEVNFLKDCKRNFKWPFMQREQCPIYNVILKPFACGNVQCSLRTTI